MRDKSAKNARKILIAPVVGVSGKSE